MLNCGDNMQERQSLRNYIYLPIARNVLQGIANGLYDEKGLKKIEGQVSKMLEKGTTFYHISRALILAHSEGLIDADRLRNEPSEPFLDRDEVLISQLYAGHVNSEIIKNLNWTLDEVYRHKRRVLKLLEVSSEYQIILWEAKRRKRMREQSRDV